MRPAPGGTARLLNGMFTVALAALLGCGGEVGAPTSPTTGSVRVTAATTGNDLDPDGYLLLFDGESGVTLAGNANALLESVDAGLHLVGLGALAPNCTVQGENPRQVTVAAGQTTDVAFSIICSATTGSIRLMTTTSGDASSTGYMIAVDGGVSQSIGLNANVTLSGIGPGDHSVSLGMMPAGCTIGGDNPATVTVTAGQTTQVTFAVTCPVVARIAFVHATSAEGQQLYLMKSDGTGKARLTTGAVVVGPVWSPSGLKIAFGDLSGVLQHISVINADGTGLTQVTCDGSCGDPAWSPDGSRIAFRTNRDGSDEIYTMEPSGSSPVRLTNASGYDGQPAWSPDASKIVFVSNRDGGEEELYVMNADGSAQTRLTNSAGADYQPAWSPDGSLIAFTSRRDGADGIYVMQPDGSGVVRLSLALAGDSYPAWSPDGTRLVFTTLRNSFGDLYVMNADGSGQVPLTQNPAGTAADLDAAWAR